MSWLSKFFWMKNFLSEEEIAEHRILWTSAKRCYKISDRARFLYLDQFTYGFNAWFLSENEYLAYLTLLWADYSKLSQKESSDLRILKISVENLINIDILKVVIYSNTGIFPMTKRSGYDFYWF